MVEGRFLVAEKKTCDNCVKIVRVFDKDSVFWFSDLKDASGIGSLSYFSKSLAKLKRLGVLVEVRPGCYALDRGKLGLLEQ